jgi:hypothetical protein
MGTPFIGSQWWAGSLCCYLLFECPVPINFFLCFISRSLGSLLSLPATLLGCNGLYVLKRRFGQKSRTLNEGQTPVIRVRTSPMTKVDTLEVELTRRRMRVSDAMLAQI